jgi:hypothetical protein
VAVVTTSAVFWLPLLLPGQQLDQVTGQLVALLYSIGSLSKWSFLDSDQHVWVVHLEVEAEDQPSSQLELPIETHTVVYFLPLSVAH